MTERPLKPAEQTPTAQGTMSRRAFIALCGAAAAAAAAGWALLRQGSASEGPKHVRWDPLAGQVVQPDTTYLLDLDVEATLRPGWGGMVAANAAGGDLPPWLGGRGKVAVVPGKYRKGLKSLDPASGFLTLPMDGLINPTEFTIEFNIVCDVGWAALSPQQPFLAFQVPFDDGHTLIEGITFALAASVLTVRYSHYQSAAGPVDKRLTHTATVAAHVSTNVALTLRDGGLTLYVDGLPAAAVTGVAPAASWHSGVELGVTVPGSNGLGTLGIAVSDLRISRRARVLGSTSAPSSANVLSVRPTAPTGAVINQKLRGALHGGSSPAADSLLTGMLSVVRTANLVTATPMIAGGVPDAAHPSVGQSRGFCYDWRVVDHTLAYIMDTLGCEAYLSMDSCPMILGGRTPPATPAQSSDPKFRSVDIPAYDRTVPNDFAAFGRICSDMVYHIRTGLGRDVPRFGLWNEPDGAQAAFWSGTQAQYQSMYRAWATAIRAANPGARLGGPEISSYRSIVWLTDLIAFCQARSVPLDFVSWHAFSGSISELASMVHRINVAATTARRATPEIVIGEHAALHPAAFSQRPWAVGGQGANGDVPMAENDFAGSVLAAEYIEAQRLGIARFITCDFTRGHAGGLPGGSFAHGLVSDTGVFATGNVLRLWKKMAPNVLEQTLDADPGISAVASNDGSVTGKHTVLLANVHYRKGRAYPVSIHLPGVADGRPVTATMIDDQHSSAYDVGDSGGLQTIVPNSGPTVTDGHVMVTLKARAVCLLEIAP